MKRALFWFWIGLALWGAGMTTCAQAEPTCPVMPGERVSKKYYADYQGRRIYLCCRPCVKKFKRQPERYLARLSQTLAKTEEESCSRPS